jgi:hypothetical protein
MRPLLKALTAGAAQELEPAELAPLLRRQRRLIAVNFLLLLSAAWVMVFKPS